MTKLARRLPAVTLVLLASGIVTAEDTPPAAKPEEQVTLLGMLGEWMYPGSKFNGATSSDAAVADIVAIKSHAVLTTPDSVEKVMTFYREKLNVDGEGDNLGAKEGERLTTSRSVLIQDLSGDDPNSLFVIAVNGPGKSTTLVVSRPGETDTTRIGWTNYRQLHP